MFFMALCAAYLDVRNHKGRLYREINIFLFVRLAYHPPVLRANYGILFSRNAGKQINKNDNISCLRLQIHVRMIIPKIQKKYSFLFNYFCSNKTQLQSLDN